MNKSDFPRCRTCDHYEFSVYMRDGEMVESDENGHCRFISTGTYGQSSVDPDFGCIMHTSLEDDD